MTKQVPKIVSLRIFFDPPGFKAWRDGMGPMTVLYMDPYGLELILDNKTDQWRLYLDRKELHVNLETDEIYELARLEIEDGCVFRTA